MRYALLHPPSLDLEAIADALASEDVETRTVASARDLRLGDIATVLVLDALGLDTFEPQVLHRFVEAGGAVIVLGSEGQQDIPEALEQACIDAWIPWPHGHRQLLLALRSAYRAALLRREMHRARQDAAIRGQEISELTRLGAALSTERDYHKLLNLILSHARRLTAADAGSLYLVEEDGGAPRLRFKLAQNSSLGDLEFHEFTMPLDPTSLAGYVASSGAPLRLDDAYDLPAEAPYRINRSFDEKHGYRTRSMLAIPMQNHRDEIIGVLQLINRKHHFEELLSRPQDFAQRVIPFDQRNVDLVVPLAAQAAISLENSQLYESIERLFEGFVTAAVTAIEQRDPTTSGHSLRVADMTVDLARILDRIDTGRYREVQFSRSQIKELRYAGLLHDFGKVGVREQVLVKAKKLYPEELELIRHRHAFIRKNAETELLRGRLQYLESHGRNGYDQLLARLGQEHAEHVAALDRLMQLIVEANEPTVVHEGTFDELKGLAANTFLDFDGAQRPLLTPHELHCLTIRKGSLDQREREEVESHVEHTYRFLMQIPWTKELKDIPLIAYGHHEKLNGSGYPRRVREADIPIQTRMMTIADIFDALTASDRPYKRAVSVERALDIMGAEVEGQMLDQDLFKIFVEARIFGHLDTTAGVP